MLGSEFATLMLVSGHATDLKERLREATKRLEWERRLTIFVRPLDRPEEQRPDDGNRLASLRVTGVDQAGIVAGVARCLADHEVLIHDLRGAVTNVPQSGTPLYTLAIRMLIPKQCAGSTLRMALNQVAERLEVEVDWDDAGS